MLEIRSLAFIGGLRYIYIGDFMAPRRHVFNQVSTDKTGPTGHKKFHGDEMTYMRQPTRGQPWR
jgi:hypothetical protein